MPEKSWRTSCCRCEEVCVCAGQILSFFGSCARSFSRNLSLSHLSLCSSSQYPITLSLFSLLSHPPLVFLFISLVLLLPWSPGIMIHYSSQLVPLFIHSQVILEWWIVVRRTSMERKISRQLWRLRGSSSCPTHRTGTWLIKWAPHGCRECSTRWS